MSINIFTAAISGITGVIVSVEVDMARGLPCFNIVGLGDESIKESKERVRAAIVNSGFEFPMCRITVNLAPADLKKKGSLFDLPIAIGILTATKQMKRNTKDLIIMGELSLNGQLKPVSGALAIAIAALKNKFKGLVLPEENYYECSILEGITIHPFFQLSDVVKFINGECIQRLIPPKIYTCDDAKNDLDYIDVYGLNSTKRAVEVAASGNHNMVLIGSPGSGKTMIASRIPSILPPLNYDEAIEVTKIYSITGKLKNINKLMTNRPFRNPHHSASNVAIIGGGSNLFPGEITLANKGVLFLDEMLEFNKTVLQSLREPLEERKILISRASGTVEYPADIMLVGATNPCNCGNYGSDKECICSEHDRRRYLSRFAGPLLDRMDIFTFVKPTPFNTIVSHTNAESSQSIKERVIECRKIQSNRFKDDNITCNSQMNEKHIEKYCIVDENCKDLLRKIYEIYQISTRAYTRILKISRTIADMDNSKNINMNHITEALQYRQFLSKDII